MIVDGPSPRRQTGLPPVVPAVVCAGGTRALSPDGGLTVNVPAARSTSPPLATKPLAHVLLMLAWSVTPVASPLGNTTATADVLPATHAGVPETSVSTWPLAPAPSRVAAPARPPTMMSPGWLIGLLKPDVALAQTGSPPTVVSTWLGPPMPSRTGVPPGLLVIRSPVVVIGLAKPAALFCHATEPSACTVSTCAAVPIGTRWNTASGSHGAHAGDACSKKSGGSCGSRSTPVGMILPPTMRGGASVTLAASRAARARASAHDLRY